MKAIKKITMAILWVITIVIVYFWVTEYLFPKDTTSEYVVTSADAAREASDMLLSEVYDEYTANPKGFAINHEGERIALDTYERADIISNEVLWVYVNSGFIVCEATAEDIAVLDSNYAYYIIGTIESAYGSDMTLTNCTFIQA